MDDGVTEAADRLGGLPRSLAGPGRRDKRGGLRLVLALAAAGVLLHPAAARSQAVPPDEAWRSIETAHFRVTFPASLDGLGRRAAVLAEDARTRLADAFLDAPGGRVEVVLTDHVDASNGFASVAPLPRIVIYARPPVDGGALSHYDDWLDLVLVHELAHVVHLDRTGRLGGLLRGVFGRVPASWPFFPGLAAPRWTVEGLATWYESDLTGAGRVHGSVFPMFLRTAALEGRLETLDRASGESPAWPSGQRPYLYGSLFFDWLLERHGPDRLTAFVEALAGQWIPYRLDSAARTAFGESFSDAWDAWAAEVEADARATARRVAERSSLPTPTRLTEGARQALHPRVSPSDGRLAYTRLDGRSDPHVRIVGADGSEERVRADGGGAFDWLPDGGLVFRQFALEGPWRIRSDLFVRGPGGDVRRVTAGARLDHPSSAPDGRWVAAIRTRDGHTDLVRVGLEGGTVQVVAAGSDSVHWAFPSVSPDGRWIAASRWTPDRLFQVVVVDADTGREALAVSEGRSVDLAAAWAPGGGWLVWASDRSGIPNLYAAEVDPVAGRRGPLRQVTDLATGASLPSVTPDGTRVLFSLYTAGGWEAAQVPFDPGGWRDPVPGAADAPGPRPRVTVASLDTLQVRPYSSAATLRPRYWEPVATPAVRSGGRSVLGPFVGAATTLSDVVGRHTLAASASVAVDRGNVEGAAAWTWAGWGNPLLSVAVGQGWDASGPYAVGEGSRVFVEERERSAAGAVTLLRSRWRSSLALTASAGIVLEDRTLLDATDLEPSREFRLRRPSSRLGDLRLSASFSTARAHELSLSAERGLQLAVQARTRPHLDVEAGDEGVVGLDRSVDEVVGQARGYLSFGGWGWTDHVLALRVAGGRAVGPGADAFWYDVGGAAGRPEGVTGLGLVGGRNLFFPVRGYEDGDRSGARAWVASLEWRFPVAWVRRGPGPWPLHLERIHGAIFADAGNAWGPRLPVPGYDAPRQRSLASAGAELRTDFRLFFSIEVDVRAGVAWRLVDDRGARAYVRLGPSF